MLCERGGERNRERNGLPSTGCLQLVFSCIESRKLKMVAFPFNFVITKGGNKKANILAK